MTPGEELELFTHDPAAWRQAVAPRMASVLAHVDDAKLGQTWQLMSRGYQCATWNHLDNATRTRIRAARTKASTTGN